MAKVLHNPVRSQKEINRDRERRRKNMSEIARINNCARKIGMSYGEYVSKQREKRLESQKEST